MDYEALYAAIRRYLEVLFFGYWNVTTWYYDATNGSDSNTGTTADSRLQTIAELYRRTFGANTLTPVTLIVAAELTQSEADLFSVLASSSARQWAPPVIG